MIRSIYDIVHDMLCEIINDTFGDKVYYTLCDIVYDILHVFL